MKIANILIISMLTLMLLSVASAGTYYTVSQAEHSVSGIDHVYPFESCGYTEYTPVKYCDVHECTYDTYAPKENVKEVHHIVSYEECDTCNYVYAPKKNMAQAAVEFAPKKNLNEHHDIVSYKQCSIVWVF